MLGLDESTAVPEPWQASFCELCLPQTFLCSREALHRDIRDLNYKSGAGVNGVTISSLRIKDTTAHLTGTAMRWAFG